MKKADKQERAEAVLEQARIIAKKRNRTTLAVLTEWLDDHKAGAAKAAAPEAREKDPGAVQRNAESIASTELALSMEQSTGA